MAIAKKPATHRAEPAAQNSERAAEAFIAKAGNAAQEPENEERKIPVTMRYDRDILKRVDGAAKRQGISRSAYVHIALSQALEREP